MAQMKLKKGQHSQGLRKIGEQASAYTPLLSCGCWPHAKTADQSMKSL